MQRLMVQAVGNGEHLWSTRAPTLTKRKEYISDSNFHHRGQNDGIVDILVDVNTQSLRSHGGLVATPFQHGQKKRRSV